MKITGFVASPRVGGNTETVVSEILAGARENGAEVKLVNIAESKISGCTACGYCGDHEACSINDDMTDIYEDIRSSDAIIVGSPVYMWQMTAQAKAFLDRLMPFLNADLTSRIRDEKRLVLVFSQAHPNKETFQEYFEQTGKVYMFIGFKLWKIISAAGVMKSGDVKKNKELLEEARETGRSLCR